MPGPAAPSRRDPVVALGIDVGSTNTKAVVVAVDADGGVHEAVVRRAPTPSDVPELLQVVQDLAADAVLAARLPIAAVGIASMAETGAPLDADGRALTPLLTWQGAATDEDDALVALLDGADRFAATGVPATPKPPLVAIARLRRLDPSLAARMRRWAGVADLVALALTGRLATDPTLALRTGAYRLPPAGSTLARGYDPALLAPFGLGVDLLPEVAHPLAPGGAVQPTAAGRTGLAVGTPVSVAGHDHLVGAWAAGVREPGAYADSLGTAEAVLRFPAEDVDRRALHGSGTSVVRAVDGRREGLLTATTGAGAAVRAWFGGPAPEGVFDRVERGLPDLGDLVVLPYPAGRQAPSPDPMATLRLVDRVGAPVDRDDVPVEDAARALLVGLALQARWMDDEQRAITRSAPEPGVVLGGAGAANRAWLRAKAAVAAGPLSVVPESEPVAVGAALLAAVRAGLLAETVRLRPRPLDRGAVAPDLLFRLAAFRASATAAPEGAR